MPHSYPQTREEYRAAILANICRLVAQVEADQNEYGSAESLARSLHHDVREFFDETRWKPNPVYDGITARVPLGQPLTLLIVHHDGPNGRCFVQGRVQAIHHPGRPSDGAVFEVVPKGCRNVRRHRYAVMVGAALTIYPGWVEETRLEHTRPLYDHAAIPPVRYDQ